MKNKMSVLIAGLLAALVVIGVLGATNAYAQSQTSGLLHGGGPAAGVVDWVWKGCRSRRTL